MLLAGAIHPARAAPYAAQATIAAAATEPTAVMDAEPQPAKDFCQSMFISVSRPNGPSRASAAACRGPLGDRSRPRTSPPCPRPLGHPDSGHPRPGHRIVDTGAGRMHAGPGPELAQEVERTLGLHARPQLPARDPVPGSPAPAPPPDVHPPARPPAPLAGPRQDGTRRGGTGRRRPGGGCRGGVESAIGMLSPLARKMYNSARYTTFRRRDTSPRGVDVHGKVANNRHR